MATVAAEIPGNVPRDLVVDFDLFAFGDAPEGIQLAMAKLHKGPDIVWTPHNGGHWIATRAADIEEIQLDYAHFSQRHFTVPRNEVDPLALPMGIDPPEHTPYRSVLMSFLTPRAVRALGEVARETARKLVAEIAPRGKCEFVEEFAKVLPIHVFLGMVNLPFEDKAYLLPLAEVATRSSDPVARVEANRKMKAYLATYVDRRIENPGDDLLSVIGQGDINGRRMTRDEVLRMAALVMGGGLDTVASSLGFMAHFLATNPGHRADLLAHPQLRQNACEELLRRFGIVNTARVLTMDYDFRGIGLRKDDLIVIPKCLYALDDRVNTDPEVVDFHRKPSTIKHTSFGAGPHICPGSVLARREIMVFFDEWLPVVPDFELDPDDKVVMASGSVNGVLRLPLRWKVRGSG